MRSPGKWLLILACAAFVALVGAPALADDVVIFDVSNQVRIGSLVLEPGTYLIRSSSARQDRNVLAVWSPDEDTFYGFVLANYASFSKKSAPEHQLVFDGNDSHVIKAWTVAWRGSTYFFSAAPVSTAPASRGKAGSVVAAR